MTSALMVLRGQGLTKGHTGVLTEMCHNHETVIAALGSTGREIDFSNPFTHLVRKQMIQNVFGDRVKVIYLEDIHSGNDPDAWCNYVLQKCKEALLPEPTDYYTGSEIDSIWYKSHFKGEQLHILDRMATGIPSATEIRTLIAWGDESWKKWIAPVNHRLIEDNFPEKFKNR